MIKMNIGQMTLSPAQEKIIRLIEGSNCVNVAKITEALGRGYTDDKVRSMVLTLARKGCINNTAAGLILHGTPMYKFLTVPFGSAKK